MGIDIDDGYGPAENVYRRQVEPDGSLSLATVELVGTAVDRDPTDLPPLHDRIDAEALDSLFRPMPGSPGRARGVVEFTYVGCRVRIHADGEIVVRLDELA